MEIQQTTPTQQAVDCAHASGAFSEQFLRGLVEPELGHRHRLALCDGACAGLWATDGTTAELAVDPAYRRRGIATALLRAEPLPVWLHQQGADAEPAHALADTLGWHPVRTLQVLALSDPQLRDAAEGAAAPEGYRRLNLTESCTRWGSDHVEEAWLAVNNRAFDWHPEQGGWTRADLRRAMDTDWFDPADVLLLWQEDTGELAGFHWTKWHGEGLGEVYVIGLDPDFQGRGLAGPLLRLGLARQVARGARRVILYVEADNAAALKVYAAQGFVVAEEHVLFAPKD